MTFLKPQYSFSPHGLNAKLCAASTSSTLKQFNKCHGSGIDQLAQVVTLLTCFQKVLSSNPSQDTNYPEKGHPCPPLVSGEDKEGTNTAKTTSFHIITNSCLTDQLTILPFDATV